MIFEGYSLFSDVDGTLIDDKKTGIPDKNIKAIKYFTDNGGKFTIASGRPWQRVKPYYDALRGNMPGICSNGSLIYDFSGNKVIKATYMDNFIKSEIHKVVEKFPFVTLGIYADDKYRIYNKTEENIPFIVKDTLTEYKKDDKLFERPWLKANMLCSPSKIDIIKDYFEKKDYYKNYSFSKSEHFLYEAYSNGGTKGSAILSIAEFLNMDKNKTVAIGDYENDLSMLSTAGISFCPSNGCKSVKDTVTYVLETSNNDGALYECVNKLEEIIRNGR